MKYRNHYIRFFISSTFVDMENERNWLAEIFEKLNTEYEKKEGWQIEYVDLRWGVSELDSIDNRTMEICLDELELCKNLSPKPNFIALLGQRYGWVPWPSEIPYSRLSGLSMRFLKYYRRDFNSTAFQKYKNPFQFWGKKETVVNEGPWRLISTRELSSMSPEEKLELQKTGLEGFKSASNGFKKLNKKEDENFYYSSATEREIRSGALSANDADKHVICYFRELEQVPENLKETYQPIENADRLHSLKEELTQKIPTKNIIRSTINFPGYNSQKYEQEFKARLEECIRRVVDAEIAETKQAQTSLFAIEEAKTFSFREDVTRNFMGREKELEEIYNFVYNDDEHTVMWIDGASGIGKSALIATALNKLTRNYNESLNKEKRKHLPFFIRCGSTDITSTPGGTMQLFLSQLYYILKPFLCNDRLCKDLEKYDDKTQDQDWEQNFYSTLRDINKIHNIPIVVIFDGISELNPEKSRLFEDLEWLGFKPKNENQWVCEVLKGKNSLTKFIFTSRHPFLGHPDSMMRELHLQNLSTKDSMEVINEILCQRKRTISSEQRAVVEQRIANGCNPSYPIMLGNYLSRHVFSWTNLPELPSDSQGMVRFLIRHAIEELHHGPHIVFLALIAIAITEGVSDKDMIQLLSLDPLIQKAHQDSTLHKTQNDAKVPPIYWYRLSHDISDIIHHEQTPYGEANCLKSTAYAQTIVDMAREYNSSDGKTSIWGHVLRVIDSYCEKQWSNDNKFAVYNAAFVRKYLIGSKAMFQLLFNIRYTSVVVEMFGTHIGKLFDTLLSAINKQNDNFFHSNNRIVELEQMRSWLLSTVGLKREQVLMHAANLPDSSPIFRALQTQKIERRLIMQDLLKNNIGHQNVVYRTVIQNVVPIAMDDSANRILYQHLRRKTLVVFDRTLWKSSTWNFQTEILSIRSTSDLRYIICVLDKGKTIGIIDTQKADGLYHKINFQIPLIDATISYDNKIMAGAYGKSLMIYNLVNKTEIMEFSIEEEIKELLFAEDGYHLWILSDTQIHHIEADGNLLTTLQIREEANKYGRYNIVTAAANECFVNAPDAGLRLKYVDDKILRYNFSYLAKTGNIFYWGTNCARFSKEGLLSCSIGSSYGGVLYEINSNNSLLNSLQIPSLVHFTRDRRYGLTKDGLIINLNITANHHFAHISKGTNLFKKEFTPTPVGINGASASAKGDWIVCTAGRRHDEISLNALSICKDKAGKYKHCIVEPRFYECSTMVHIGTSAVAPDGSICAITSSSTSPGILLFVDKIINVLSRINLPCDGNGGNYLSLCWTNDSKFLIALTWHPIVDTENVVVIVNRDGEIMQTIKLGYDFGCGDYVKVKVSSDNKYVTIFSNYNNCVVIEIQTGKIILKFDKKFGERINYLPTSISNQLLLKENDGTVLVYSYQNPEKEPVCFLKGCESLLAVSPTNRYIFVTMFNHSGELSMIDHKAKQITNFAVKVKRIVTTDNDQLIYIQQPNNDILLFNIPERRIIKKMHVDVAFDFIQSTQSGLLVVPKQGSPMLLA